MIRLLSSLQNVVIIFRLAACFAFTSCRRSRDFAFNRETVARVILVRINRPLRRPSTRSDTCENVLPVRLQRAAARPVFLANRSPEGCPKYLDV